MMNPVVGRPVSLDTLPDDILFLLVSYFDIQSIGRFSCCCRRLHRVCGQDCVWLRWKKSLFMVKSPSKEEDEYFLPIKEQCRLSKNWIEGRCYHNRQIHHSVKQLPWMQLDKAKLWISSNNRINCYSQKANGHLLKPPQMVLGGHSQDVGRFKCKQGLVVSGSREASICAYSSDTGQMLLKIDNCHTSDIQDVDFHNTVIVSGSRDGHVKIWSMADIGGGTLKYDIDLLERVWSLGINPDGESFVTGTAGINSSSPLRLWDTETGQLLACLGSEYRHGAGVLDVHYESPDVVFSCGHDTLVRMWDLRLPPDKCVVNWVEPYDSAVYTVRSDGGHSVIAGTAQHGLVHLWDKRNTKNVQKYYVGQGHTNSPVYSLAFDPQYMYIALDKEITLVDFTSAYTE